MDGTFGVSDRAQRQRLAACGGRIKVVGIQMELEELNENSRELVTTVTVVPRFGRVGHRSS